MSQSYRLCRLMMRRQSRVIVQTLLMRPLSYQQSLDGNTPFTPPMSTCPASLLFRAHDSCLGAVSEPDKSRVVVVHALDECPPVRLSSDLHSIMDDRPVQQGIVVHSGTIMQLQKGQNVQAPYAIRAAPRIGQCRTCLTVRSV